MQQPKEGTVIAAKQNGSGGAFPVVIESIAKLGAQQIITVRKVIGGGEFGFQRFVQPFVADAQAHSLLEFILLIGENALLYGYCAGMRNQLTANATSIDYATQLRQAFRAVIVGAMDELKMLPGEMASHVMETIERHVQSFFVQALQLDARTLRLEAK